MMKYCFAYFNKLGDFYGQPFFVDHKDEFVKILGQTLYAAKKDDLEALKEDDLYFIGSFNNETGDFKPEKEFITSMSGMVTGILAKKFGESEHGEQA